MDKYFRFPSEEEYFKDIIESDIWQEDNIFVEQRLAGLNPMPLKKLTLRGSHLYLAHVCMKTCQSSLTFHWRFDWEYWNWEEVTTRKNLKKSVLMEENRVAMILVALMQ